MSSPMQMLVSFQRAARSTMEWFPFRRDDVTALAIVSVAYMASAWIGFQFAFTTQQVTAIWPPTGIALAAILLRGPRMAAGIFVGAFLSNAMNHTPLLAAAGIAIGNTLAPLCGAYLLKRFATFDSAMSRVRDVVSLAFLGSVFPMAISATNGVINLAVSGIIPWSATMTVWRTWWIGDTMGALLVAPVVLTLASNSADMSRLKQFELWALYAASVLGTALILSSSVPLAYPVFPIVIWTALRFGPRQTAISILLISAMAAWQTAHYHGPFTSGALDHRLLLLVTFLAVLAVTGLALAAVNSGRRSAEKNLRQANEKLEARVRERTEELATSVQQLLQNVAERQAAEERLTQSEQRFRGAFETAAHGMALISTEGRWLKVNRAICDIVGYSEQELLATDFQTITHPEDLDADMIQLNQLVAGEISSYHMEKRYFRKDGSIVWILLSVSLVRDAKGAPVHFVSQILDVTDRREAKEALRNARDAADSANRAKSKFLTTMSHEIRTPMNGILGLSGLLLDTPLSPEQKYRVQLIENAGKSLMTIVNDVLDVSKIEAGKFVPERVAVNPSAICRDAVEIVRPHALSKNLRLRTEVDPDFPDWVEGDPTRLRQILFNLLSNAIKYTEHGDIVVALRVDAVKARLRIEVQDTGIGIPSDKRALLFHEFAQLGEDCGDGYGLGLSISRILVEAMGGKIGFDSDLEIGSTFWFELPLREAISTNANANTSPSIRPTGSARILVAEDLLLNQIVIEGILRSRGHEVSIVDNGAKALAALQERHFDVVLMDMEMPVMDGLSATRNIRRLNESVRGIPIIGLTANAFSEEKSKCLSAGMNGHLSKPIDRDLLLQTIGLWTGEVVEAVPQIAKPQSDDVLSDAWLRELERDLGPDHVAALIALFRVNLDEVVSIITSSGDQEQTKRAAHSLISLAGSFGCTELVTRSRELLMAVGVDGVDVRTLVREAAAAAHRAQGAIDLRYPR